MGTLKYRAIKVKNHLNRQKYAYAFAAIAVLAVQGNLRNAKAITKFLTEKGIDPLEYFCQEAFEELNP